MVNLVITASAIIFLDITLRWASAFEMIDSRLIPANFQGYASNRNAFAFQLLICIALVIANIRNLSDKYAGGIPLSIANITWLGFLLAGLILTGSRAGLATCLVLLVLAGILHFLNVRTIVFVTLVAAVIWLMISSTSTAIGMILAYTCGVDPCLHNNASNFVVQSAISQPISNIERWKTIWHGVDMWLDYPLFGAGLGAFIEMSKEWSKQPIVIHSTPIWILAEFGLFGASIFLAIFGWVVAAVFRSGFDRLENRLLIMILCVFMVFGTVHEIFNQRIFWLALGLCVALPLSGGRVSPPPRAA